jgi:hypothetical protein
MVKYLETFHPARPDMDKECYARCGSHRPISNTIPNRTICIAMLAENVSEHLEVSDGIP